MTYNEMLHRTSNLITSARDFLAKEFLDGELCFCLIYGSYAYKVAKSNSDLDLLIVSNQNVTKDKITRSINFVHNLHSKHSMDLDHEIPYEKKLVLSRSFFQDSCTGNGIYTNSRWQIPPIDKNPEYLASPRLLSRFLIGMMCGPHIFVSGNYLTYKSYAMLASRNMLRAIISTNELEKFTSADLIPYYCTNKENTCDTYIGFSNNRQYHVTYLLEHIEATLATMPSNEIIKEKNLFYINPKMTHLEPELYD